MTTSPDDPALNPVARASADFGFRLLRRLIQDTPYENVFISPLSISAALAMALTGAGGQTARDMTAALGLGALTQAQVNDGNERLLSSLVAADPGATVKIANALWARQGFTLAPDFQAQCRRYYQARTESLDFHSPEAAATINAWVSQSTDGKIARLVSHADVAPSTAVLTNAVYFQGRWQTPFDPSATRDAAFALANGSTKTVPMMSRSGRFLYAETPQGQCVGLPYGTGQEGRLSLIVVLPPPGQKAVELDVPRWKSWMAALAPVRLTLFLPRFKAAYEARLRASLSALGMASAFTDGADFKPMGLCDSYLGDVIHKAVLEVDEAGTVAAAATAVVMMRTALARPAPVMRVDRPFVLAIWDSVTEAVLFMGVIYESK